MAIGLLPFCDFQQHQTHIFLVTDEVVINDKDCAAPTKIAQRVKFSNHLLVALGARNSAVNLYDVAEFARERTTARVLNGHRAVAFHVCELKVRQRGGGKWRALRGLVGTLGLASGEIVDELLYGGLSPTEKNVIGFR